MNMGEKNKIIL